MFQKLEPTLAVVTCLANYSVHIPPCIEFDCQCTNLLTAIGLTFTVLSIVETPRARCKPENPQRSPATLATTELFRSILLQP